MGALGRAQLGHWGHWGWFCPLPDLLWAVAVAWGVSFAFAFPPHQVHLPGGLGGVPWHSPPSAPGESGVSQEWGARLGVGAAPSRFIPRGIHCLQLSRGLLMIKVALSLFNPGQGPPLGAPATGVSLSPPRHSQAPSSCFLPGMILPGMILPWPGAGPPIYSILCINPTAPGRNKGWRM